ncbi:syntaxin-22-like [Hibiscus syriacus]|uniref:syntaxin-22-like n=1 Tax=Hibiscus syriacus TaxID=106335 RepID=UPI001921B7C0|nr:syntaxin-22-like [Hibiscus syriacus]
MCLSFVLQNLKNLLDLAASRKLWKIEAASISFVSALPCCTGAKDVVKTCMDAGVKAKLKQASETDHRAEVGANKKVTDAKLAKDFQAVLKEFQKAQRLAAERETSYTPFVPQTVIPSSYTAGEVEVASDKSAKQRALLMESRK